MAIRYVRKSAQLEGRVTVEEAEGLSEWLKKHPKSTVNLGKCEHVHAAVLQVLMALRPAVKDLPGDRWLAVALAGLARA